MEGMSDVPSWNAIDRPVLEAVALLASQGEAPDDGRLSTILPAALSGTEVRQSLVRLIARGFLTGSPIGAWQESVPVRVVNLVPTSAGLAELSR